MPLSLPEYALELVQAGFKPTELGILREKIRYIVQQVIESAVEKYRIPLQESISAYVVPGERSINRSFGLLLSGVRSAQHFGRRRNILPIVAGAKGPRNANNVFCVNRTGAGKYCLTYTVPRLNNNR